MTIMQNIYNKLKSLNLNPYYIGQHQGECTEKYVVIKEGTQSPFIMNRKNGYKIIDIIIFVPIDSYIAMEQYKDLIISGIAELSNIKKTGTETPVISDNEIKAYTMSVEYQILKKL